jgi:hypothetical protein
MYLFTMLFLLLTIIGIFTQIVSAQNLRFAANKISGAEQMLAWHGAAAKAAQYGFNNFTVFNNPTPTAPFQNIVWGDAAGACSLLVAGQPDITGIVRCRDATNLQPAALDNLQVDPNDLGASRITTLLPAGYNLNNFFTTIVFSVPTGLSAGSRLVMTYLNPNPIDADAPVQPIGLSTSQIFRQVKKIKYDTNGYGYVVAGVLRPAGQINSPGAPALNLSYDLPIGLLFNAATNPTGPVRNGAFVLFTPL